ncbi:MAG: aldolase/citrate lyase family protein [Planctomycetota bacterium]
MPARKRSSAVKETNILRRRLAAGETVHMGAFGQFLSPQFAELMAAQGDIGCIWLDVEHGIIGPREMYLTTLAVRGRDVSVFARVAPTDYRAIMLPLEAGLEGIMAAMVTSAAQAREIVAWAKFREPDGGHFPGGRRGYNPGGPDGFFGTQGGADYARARNAATYVIIQIETREALAEVEAIAAIEGVDGVFFGPGDFSQAAGHLGDFMHRDCLKAMDRIAAAVDKAGKWWSSLGGTPRLYRAVKERNCRLICVGGENSIIRTGLAQMCAFGERMGGR